MFKFKKTWSVVFLIFLFLILLIVIQSYEKKAVEEKINNYGCLKSAGYTWNETLQSCVRQWEIDSRIYSSKDLNECKNIDIKCSEEYGIFNDKTGCGCQLKTAIQKNIYCTSKQRKTDACIEIYKPVCAYLNSGETKTYSNSCFACKDANVFYYQDGKCEN